MFKNKLLMALLKPFFMFADGDEGGGGFDMAAASDAISEGLFGESKDGGDSGDSTDLGDGKSTDIGDTDPADLAAPVDGKAAAPAPAPATDDPNAPAPTPTPEKSEVPKTWRPEAAAEWEKLPPLVQQEVLKREADIFRGIEALKPDANVGKAFQSALRPFEQFMVNTKTDPVALTRDLAQAHFTLSVGTPEQKMAVLQRISSAYGVPLTAPNPDDEPPYVDPQVKALQDQLKAVQSQLSGTADRQAAADQAEQTRIRNELSAEIEAFANDPANKHYATVESDMADILKAGLAKDLKDAYEQAVWRNPVSRVAEQTRLSTEAAQKAQEEKVAKAKLAAKAASTNVRTSAKQASGTTLLGSIDDTLKEALANINARDK